MNLLPFSNVQFLRKLVVKWCHSESEFLLIFLNFKELAFVINILTNACDVASEVMAFVQHLDLAHALEYILVIACCNRVVKHYTWTLDFWLDTESIWNTF